MAAKTISSVQNSALTQFSCLPDEAGVRLPTVCSLMSCSGATVWRMVKAGKIKAHKVSERVTVFNVGSLRSVLRGEGGA